MRKRRLGCIGAMASALLLIVAYFLFVPAPVLQILALEGRVNGLAEVKKTFPEQDFSWLDLFRSRFIFSWDGTDIIWHFDPPSPPLPTPKTCTVEDVWDGRDSIHSIKACLIGKKLNCERRSLIRLYRVTGDGSLIVHRTTGSTPHEYCLDRDRRSSAKLR